MYQSKILIISLIGTVALLSSSPVMSYFEEEEGSSGGYVSRASPSTSSSSSRSSEPSFLWTGTVWVADGAFRGVRGVGKFCGDVASVCEFLTGRPSKFINF